MRAITVYTPAVLLLNFKIKKRRSRNAERPGDLEYLAYAGVDHASLNAADLAQLQVGGKGELFLRKPLFLAQMAQSLSKRFYACLVPLVAHAPNMGR